MSWKSLGSLGTLNGEAVTRSTDAQKKKKKEKRHKKNNGKCRPGNFFCHKQETARVTSYPKKKWLLLGCFVVHFPGSGSDKGTIN